MTRMPEQPEVIGETTAPEGCEPFQVRVINNKREPIEIVGGCVDFKLATDEAEELARLLKAAAKRVRTQHREASRV